MSLPLGLQLTARLCIRRAVSKDTLPRPVYSCQYRGNQLVGETINIRTTTKDISQRGIISYLIVILSLSDAKFLQALNHPYFFQPPNPTHHTKLPKSKPAIPADQDVAPTDNRMDLMDALKGPGASGAPRKRKSSTAHEKAKPPSLRQAVSTAPVSS